MIPNIGGITVKNQGGMMIDEKEIMRLQDDGCPHVDIEDSVCEKCGINISFLKEAINNILKYLEECDVKR